jgi:diguanylate cyclase (GGDEF)-like protein
MSDNGLPSKGVNADLSDVDQTVSDADQSSADLDQTSSDADQGASEIDQVASDRDQRASDLDQEDSDRAQATGAVPLNAAQTRRTRSQTTIQRDLASHARSDTARIRDETAQQRDNDADSRDAAANARDHLAVVLDAEIEGLEKVHEQSGSGSAHGLELLLNAANDRKRHAATRARAVTQREAAARDRAVAQRDRAAAATDRIAAADELAAEGIDHLTGTLRRRVGLGAIQRELDRTRRSAEPLVVAFIDVDGLKVVNDAKGHTAGDGLLCAVAQTITDALRPYDLIMRFGGDEFVCSLTGHDVGGARDRFDRISAQIAASQDGAKISIGLVQSGPEDTVDDLILRADREMLATRG